jgi:hypothetical protein
MIVASSILKMITGEICYTLINFIATGKEFPFIRVENINGLTTGNLFYTSLKPLTLSFN